MTAAGGRGSRRLPTWLVKPAMAITGIIWVLFVLIHLYGNLKIFSGPQSFNEYALWLRNAFAPLFPPGLVLWILRVVLVVSLGLHVAGATILWVRAHRAGGRFAARSWRARLWRGGSTWRAVSASLMPVTGVVVLAFIIFHVADLTLGVRPVAPEGFLYATSQALSAYENLISSFQRPFVAAFYMLAMSLLALHVAHGTVLIGVDLGVRGLRVRAALVWIGGAAGLIILLGNGWIPLAVQLGVLQ